MSPKWNKVNIIFYSSPTDIGKGFIVASHPKPCQTTASHQHKAITFAHQDRSAVNNDHIKHTQL